MIVCICAHKIERVMKKWKWTGIVKIKYLSTNNCATMANITAPVLQLHQSNIVNPLLFIFLILLLKIFDKLISRLRFFAVTRLFVWSHTIFGKFHLNFESWHRRHAFLGFSVNNVGRQKIAVRCQPIRYTTKDTNVFYLGLTDYLGRIWEVHNFFCLLICPLCHLVNMLILGIVIPAIFH